jgi:hypothetical protein
MHKQAVMSGCTMAMTAAGGQMMAPLATVAAQVTVT